MFKKITLFVLFLLPASLLFAAQNPVLPKEPLFPYLDIWDTPLFYCMVFTFGSYFLIPNLLILAGGIIALCAININFLLMLGLGLMLLFIPIPFLPWAYNKEEDSPWWGGLAATDSSGMFWGTVAWWTIAMSLIALMWGVAVANAWIWGIATFILVLLGLLFILDLEMSSYG